MLQLKNSFAKGVFICEWKEASDSQAEKDVEGMTRACWIVHIIIHPLCFAVHENFSVF